MENDIMENKNLNCYGYLLNCPDEMLVNIDETMKDKQTTINWNNFKVGDAFYAENTYRCAMVDHVMKRIIFTTEEEYKNEFELKYNDKPVDELKINYRISKNAIENMMLAYIDHKQILNEYESEMDEQEMEEDANYNFHKGCCETAECWMRSIGVSPDCEFVRERL